MLRKLDPDSLGYVTLEKLTLRKTWPVDSFSDRGTSLMAGSQEVLLILTPLPHALAVTL